MKKVNPQKLAHFGRVRGLVNLFQGVLDMSLTQHMFRGNNGKSKPHSGRVARQISLTCAVSCQEPFTV